MPKLPPPPTAKARTNLPPSGTSSGELQKTPPPPHPLHHPPPPLLTFDDHDNDHYHDDHHHFGSADEASAQQRSVDRKVAVVSYRSSGRQSAVGGDTAQKVRSPSSPVEGTSSGASSRRIYAASSGFRRWDSVRGQHRPQHQQQQLEEDRGKHSASPKVHYKKLSASLYRMPKYKIKYLNLRARAEPIRLLFNYVQHPYEDSRENFLEFTKYKDKLPLTHLPKLIVDGQFELSFTSVILAYLGEKFGLEADTPEEKAVCAQLAQRINGHFEYIKPFVNCLLGLIPAEKLPALADQCFWPCITEDFGPVFEKQLEVNNTGYLVGDKLTWIDFYAAAFADSALTYGRPDMLDRFPRVLHHCRAVHSLPQLQQHIKTRPDTIF